MPDLRQRQASRHVRSRNYRFLASTLSPALFAVLAACSGGGSGNSGSAPPRNGTYYGVNEYNVNYGLNSIQAANAYSVGLTGVGVTVAVIDSGIDRRNPEFQGRIHPASTNIVTNSQRDVQDTHGHGTAVAGVIGAARDGYDSHGVAYNAQILAINAAAPGSCPAGGSCGFYQSHLATATAYAVNNGAKVINYSLGAAGGIDPAFANAIGSAAGTAVIIAAAGNEGGTDPINPATLLATNQIGIAVGAVDANDQIASFSNRAGTAKNFYLVAPGVNVAVPKIGGGLNFWNGTSFAAPHVAGAAALVIEDAQIKGTPLSPAQVIDILLRSAIDLGVPGTDPIYGRGLLNLTGALQPLGTTVIPGGTTVAQGGSAVAATSMRLGPAFGDAVMAAGALRQAIALDDYGRPYRVDLSAALARSTNGRDMEAWMRPGQERVSIRQDFDSGGSFALDFSEERATAADTLRDPATEPQPPLSIAATLPGGYSLGFARGNGMDGTLGFSGAGAADIAGLIGGHAFASPFLGMAGGGESIAVGAPLGPLSVRFGIATTDADGALDGARPSATVQAGEIGYVWQDGAQTKLQFGELAERDGLLQSAGAGALSFGESARTRFVGWFGSMPLSNTTEIAGHYMAGFTEASDAPGAVLRDFSAIRSEAFGVGLFTRAVFAGSDQLGFIVSQPLRVVQGSARLDVPVARTMDGSVVRAAERIELDPSGREIDAEMEYRILFDTDESLTLNVMLQLEPGHVDAAAPAVFGGLRYRLKL